MTRGSGGRLAAGGLAAAFRLSAGGHRRDLTHDPDAKGREEVST